MICCGEKGIEAKERQSFWLTAPSMFQFLSMAMGYETQPKEWDPDHNLGQIWS